MNQIYSRQLGILLFIFLLGSALVYVPESVITQDVWVATTLATLVGLYLLYVLLTIQEMHPDLNIMQVAELSMGRIVGKFFNLLFLWGLLMATILLLFDIVLLLQIIYPKVPSTFLTASLVLLSGYTIFKGISSGARLADLYIWLILPLLILGFAVAATLFNPMYIPPVLTKIKPIIGASIYGANWPFGEMIVIALYLPFVIDLKRNKKKLYFWFGLAALVLILRSFMVLGALCPEYLKVARFPFYEIFRLVMFQDFQRIELFFFALFISVGLGAVLIAYSALNLGIRTFFALGDGFSLVFPVGLLIIALMFNSFPSDIKYLANQANSGFLVTLPIYILYPTITLIAAKIKQKLKKKTGN